MKLAKDLLLGAMVVTVFGMGVGLVIMAGTKWATNNAVKETPKFVLSTTVAAQDSKDVPKIVGKVIHHLTLNQEQVITLTGEINESAAGIATEISQKAAAGLPLFLLINSPGGSIVDGALVINAIEAVKVPVYTVCMQLCASMAAIIHQYGTQRMMMDRSVLMFHDAAGGFQGYFPHIRSLFGAIDRYVTRYNAYIAARTGMPLNVLELNEHTQMWMDAEDSLARKFTDKLVYIDVFDTNKKQVDMKSLLGIKTKPINNTPPTTNPTTSTFFDVTL